MEQNTPESFGRFVGTVETKWLSDGRRMQLLRSFTYIDSKEVEWVAPVDSIIDGASIPQLLWSIIGSPFTGKYRDASIIHDVACDQKLRPWAEVHEAFHNAMRASDVDVVQALVMYGAVYHFGPKWPVKITELIPESRVEIRFSEIQSRFVALGSQISMDKEATNLMPNDQHNNPYYRVSFDITPPETNLRESDFTQLMLDIQEKKLSLDDIRNYHPNHL
jgi:Protein of unknown function (DUF1353)